MLMLGFFSHNPAPMAGILPVAVGSLLSVAFMNLNLSSNSVGFYQVFLPTTYFLIHTISCLNRYFVIWCQLSASFTYNTLASFLIVAIEAGMHSIHPIRPIRRIQAICFAVSAADADSDHFRCGLRYCLRPLCQSSGSRCVYYKCVVTVLWLWCECAASMPVYSWNYSSARQSAIFV